VTPASPTEIVEPESRLLRNADFALAAVLLAVMCVLIVPMPTVLLDISLAVNLSLAVLILIITLSCRQPLEFSTFPSLLLFTTLARLSLNVATTRLILSDGHAGRVIQSFGNFVVGGNLLIGLVIFLILVVIQFVVVSKGANRISEVAARFTLDAMPGKQMAIDAELNAGLINEVDARKRRELITAEAEFYGAMDGAGKFVRGDAVAGLIITIINILGGLAIGMGNGLAAGDALKKYAVLTVGDGLVTQIPALLITVASGILVTKQRGKHQLSREITAQFMLSPRATRIAAGIVATLGIVPGLPFLPFAIMAGALVAFAGYSARVQKQAPAAADDAPAAAGAPGKADGGRAADAGPDGSVEALGELLKVDRLSLEIGYRLIPLASSKDKGALLDHIAMLRRQFASQLGFVVPPIRMKDNLSLDPNVYRFLIAGQEVARGTLYPDHWLAMGPDLGKNSIDGIVTTDPTFGMPAVWVDVAHRAEAEALGYAIVDAESVLVTHLTEVLREHAHEILSRDDVQKLLDKLKETAPAVVGELVPDVMGLGTVQAVLQNLLRERISIRNLPAVLEVLADQGKKVKEADALSELARQRLSRTLVETHGGDDGAIYALTLDPPFEQALADGLAGSTDPKVTAALSPTSMRRLQEAVATCWQSAQAKLQRTPVLLVRTSVRRYLSDLFRALTPRIPVLSYNEVTTARSIEAAGIVSCRDEPAAAQPARRAAAGPPALVPPQPSLRSAGDPVAGSMSNAGAL
jgi:flagellar biosynthesis protein FlhA